MTRTATESRFFSIELKTALQIICRKELCNLQSDRMSTQTDETLLFVAEWYDAMPQLKRKYLLKYFVDLKMVEMVDVKSKKTFLKKSPCPPDVTKDDFYIGAKVLLYARELEIVDYGDLKTRDKLQFQVQQCFVLLPSLSFQNWGNLVHEIIQKFGISKLKTVFLSANVADSLCKLLEENPRKSALLSEGVNLALIVNAEDGFTKLAALAKGLRDQFKQADCLFTTSNGIQTSEAFDLLFENPQVGPTVTLDSCTCCIVKPHAVKAKLLGTILQEIISQGYEVSAMKTLQFDKVQAEEFLEVYKGVVPEYADHVMQLSGGEGERSDYCY